MLRNNYWVSEEIKREIRNKTKQNKKTRDKWKWKYSLPKSMRYSKSGSKREVHSNTGLPQETRKISNKKI